MRGVACGGLVLGALAGTAWAGWVSLSLIDQIVLLGVVVVLPLSLGGQLFWWFPAAGAVLISFLVPTGWAGLLIAPLALVTCSTTVCQARIAAAAWREQRRYRSAGVAKMSVPSRVLPIDHSARLVACAYGVVGAGALAQSRFGITFLDIHEPIVELTSVHFMFAGAASLMLAVATLPQPSPGWRRAAVAAVVLTGAAPPVVATGFVTRSAIPQVGGAVLMTLGVWLTAMLHLRDAVAALGKRRLVVSGLLTVSGLAIWAPMVLAVAWAAAHYWDVPAMSVPDMARTHGLVNASGFVLCGLVARRLEVHYTPDEVSVPWRHRIT